MMSQPQPQQVPQNQQVPQPSSTSAQILKLMKNNPYTQILNGKQVTYSIMSKKQKTFLGSNQRFLCLIGIQKIGYARSFPPNLQLPLKDLLVQLPTFKQQFPISKIKTCTCNQQTLTIQFLDTKIQKWDFSCPSKTCALNWKNKIQGAIQDFTDFNSGQFKTWEDFLQYKKEKALKQQMSNTAEINNYLNTTPVQTYYQEESIFVDKDQSKSPKRNSEQNGLNYNANFQSPNTNSNLNSGMNFNPNLQPSRANSNGNVEAPQINSNGGFSGQKNERSPVKNEKQLPKDNFNLNLSGPNINTNTQSPNRDTNLNFQAPQIQANMNGRPVNANFQTPSLNPNLQTPSPNTNLQPPSINANINKPQVNTNTNLSPQINANGGLQGQGMVQSNGPKTVLYRGPEASKVQNFILQDTDRSVNNSYLKNRSINSMAPGNKEQIKNEILRQRRNWIEQFLGGQEEGQLVIEFRNYVEKVVEVIVGELHIPQQSRMFPAYEYTKQYASYQLEDIYLQIYFFTDDQYEEKHTRYQNAAVQFKNLEYLLNSTQNQGPLRVPFMMLYEYKGFLGMAKSRIADAGKNKNRQLLSILDRKSFEEDSRISAQVFTNENKCKIVSYEGKTSYSKINSNQQKVYFVDKLAQFLPTEGANHSTDDYDIIRLELINDDEFNNFIFRDRKRPVNLEHIIKTINDKIKLFVKVIQEQKQYFTNSEELAELVHFYGLNIRHLGLIYRLTTQPWIKKIIRSEIAARCVRNFFKVDIQRFTLQKPKVSSDRQVQAERKRVVSFLNVLFGNTESSLKFWKNINSYSHKFFNITVWDKDFNDLNLSYFMQAVQSNLKIVLSDHIFQRRLFSSANTFEQGDFIKFQFAATIYNLNFTDSFALINTYIQEQTLDSFHDLCEILIKETSSKIPYLQLLKNHPIHQRINQFLVIFTSPEENVELYNRIETSFLPSKFLYESKLAQIKWLLKANRFDRIEQPTRYLEQHAKHWLGQIHPIFTQLNRMLAEYFCEVQANFPNALKYATASLAMQQALFNGESEFLWRDYFLIGKVHYQSGRLDQGLKFLEKAKGLSKVQNLIDYQVYGQLCLLLAKGYINAKFYKDAYLIVKDLYHNIKQQRDQKSLLFIFQSVTMIKQLLDINQEQDSFYKFVETDFGNLISAFVNDPKMLLSSIKLIVIPYLKNVILQKSKSKSRLLSLIKQVSNIHQSSASSLEYLKVKIIEGSFPKNYFNCLRDIDSVIDEIVGNHMLDRWKSFNKIASSSLLDKIGNSQINREFEFLAILTAVFNLLGREVQEELFLLEK